MKKPVLVMFGGVSAEHEVSVVTGLQALEHFDFEQYEPHVVYVAKSGKLEYIPGLTGRHAFLSAKRYAANFGRDEQGGYMVYGGIMGRKIYPYAAYLAFHGGTGESGQLQGLLETIGIPLTGSTTEGAVIAMNKNLTKEALASAGVRTLEGIRVFSKDIARNVDPIAQSSIGRLGLPIIVKPAHLGSSIGIAVAHSTIELQKALLSAAFSDGEIALEPFLEGIVEYNCAIRTHNGGIEVSEIERPVGHDAILSFADKYERGGGKKSGMESLARELPARISEDLKQEIRKLAKLAFIAARLSGMARIDFMQAKDGTLYLTEINPIPGSMAFYLWEATGIAYRSQISDAIEEAVAEANARLATQLEYHSDIIRRFVDGG